MNEEYGLESTRLLAYYPLVQSSMLKLASYCCEKCGTRYTEAKLKCPKCGLGYGKKKLIAEERGVDIRYRNPTNETMESEPAMSGGDSGAMSDRAENGGLLGKNASVSGVAAKAYGAVKRLGGAAGSAAQQAQGLKLSEAASLGKGVTALTVPPGMALWLRSGQTKEARYRAYNPVLNIRGSSKMKGPTAFLHERRLKLAKTLKDKKSRK